MSLLLTMTGGGGGTAWTVNVSDSISLSDAANKAAGKPLSDTVTLSDSNSIRSGKGISDTVTLTDASVRFAGKVLTDTVTLTDSISPGGLPLTLFLSDTITLSDGVAVIVPPLPPFPAVSLGGGMVLPYPQRHVRRHSDTRIPKSPKASKPRKELEEDEMEIIAVLTSWLASK